MIKPSPLTASEDALQPERPLGPGDPLYDALMDETEYFRQNRQAWLHQPELRSKYVAIHHHQLIDSDTDRFALVERIRARFPSEVVLITRVQPEDPVINLPSPEIAPYAV
jgi:hypothetical protein